VVNPKKNRIWEAKTFCLLTLALTGNPIINGRNANRKCVRRRSLLAMRFVAFSFFAVLFARG